MRAALTIAVMCTVALASLAGCGGGSTEATPDIQVQEISDCSELDDLLVKSIHAAGALKDAGADYARELANIDAINARNEELGCDDVDTLELKTTFPEVYAKVGGMTDCSELQGVFDDAADRASDAADLAVLDEQRAHMNAANSRMAELGCYD